MVDFNRQQPTHMPFQPPPGLMNDPLSMLMLIYGPQFVEMAVGPGKFIPQLNPSQNIIDQREAARYQRTTTANTLAAAEAGNTEVSKKVQGLMAFVTGEKPTELNKNTADSVAGILNNPILKGVLGQAVGPENLEGIMFGQRGDPAALAAAVNRMGYFRQDPSGENRMSAQGLEQFSKGLHATLYGPGANVDEMRGLMAGQTGQLMDHLFQRGALPQSIGALAPSERAKLVSGQRDDATIQRLAKEFAHRELLKNEEYASAGKQEQDIQLEAEAPKYVARLNDTMSQIEEFQSADPRRMSPEQREKMSKVEQTEEYQALATNADASRVAKTLKDYAGAVSSVREIFGDNGNPNAPMPALLAALEQLTAGASQQMSPAKVQNVLREMRLAAKETGIGFEQLVGFSGQMQAMGDTLGIAKPLTVQNTVNAMNLIKAMDDNGAFAGNRFGQMNKMEALNEAGARIQRGEASPVGKTMAAMARAVAENPEAYRGTEVEAAVKAYNDPSSRGMYTFNGETRNLYELAGRGGAGALAQMFADSGGSTMLLTQYFHDKGTQEFQRAGAAFQTQAHEMRRVAEQRINQDVFTVMQGADPGGKIAAQVSQELGRALTTEGALLNQAERPRFLQNKATEALRNAVQAQNPNMAAADVEKEVQRLLPRFGETYEQRRTFFAQMASSVNSEMQARTGQGLTGLGQIYNSADRAAQQSVINANRARQMGFAALGNEAPLSARFGEVLNALGEGQSLSFSDVMGRMLGAVDDAGFQPQHAETIGKALAMTAETVSGASLDAGEISSLVRRAKGGDEEAMTALRQIAVLDPDKTLVSDEDIQARLADEKTYSNEEIDRLYRAAGKDPEGVDRETKIKEILKNDKALDTYFAERTGEQSVSQATRRAAAIKAVSDDDVASRMLEKKSATEIADLYKTVIPTGTARDKETQARELSRTSLGAQLSGTLEENEMTTDMLRSRAERMTNTVAGFSPEERLENERRIKQATAINKAIEGGDKNFELIEAAAPEVIRQEIGGATAAQAKEIEERMMAVIHGTAGTKENDKALAELREVLSGHTNTDKVMAYTAALRDSKEKRRAEGDQQVKQDRREQREEKKELERERDKKTQASQAVPEEEQPRQPGSGRADKQTSGQQSQSAEAAAAEAARRANQTAAQNNSGASGSKEQAMKITGNLTIQNMRAATIAAIGEPPQYSPENGATVHA